jgi:Tfp pilus assembly protein PilO
MNLPKSAKLLYAMSGGAVVFTCGILYLQNNSLNDLRAVVAGLKSKADAEKDAPQKLLQAQRDLVGLKAHLAHLEQGIPDAAYVPTMLKELEALGKTQGVEVSGLRPAVARVNPMAEKKPFDAKPYEPLDLELKGKASYGSMLKFVAALNTFPKILEVRTVTIAPGPPASQNEGNRLEVTMGIRAFLFKQPNAQKKDGLSA